MERLTKKYVDGQAYVSLNQLSTMGENECVGLPITRLARYEDLEEQGLLLRLPCKVGDKFWELNSNWHVPCIYPRTAHTLRHVIYCMERLGEVTFLTYEEAEAALEKMKGVEHENSSER